MNRSSFAAPHSTLRRWFSFILLAAIFSTGCRRHEPIAVYRIPKEAATESTSPITYKLPAGWEETTPAGMSLANFSVANHQAELSVMSFPGEGASQLNLVNIVRDSMKLPPLSDAELAKIVEPTTIGGETGSLVDLSAGTGSGTNASGARIMVAVVPHGGGTWFFKLAGVSAVVAAQKPVLLDFLKSVSFTAAANVPASPHGQSIASTTSERIPPPSEAPPPATDAAISDTGKPAWEIPSDWKEVPPTQMLLAKFVVSATDGEADVTVSSFPGDVGGLLRNINRWRGSIGLAPIEEAGLDKSYSTLDVTGGKVMLVDMNGQNPKTGKETRLVGVIWPRAGQTWFYKLMGDSAIAGREKEAFVKFVKSVKY